MQREESRRRRRRRAGTVRKGDLEPYTALRWVGTLFKAAAVFLAVAVLAEFVAGLEAAGTAALPVLLGEVARTAVLAVVLWGAGDLVRLLIHVGHDIRAERILLARLTHRSSVREGPGELPRPGDGERRFPPEAEGPPRSDRDIAA